MAKNLITGRSKNSKAKAPSKPKATPPAQDSEADLRAQLAAMKVELANAQAKARRETGSLSLKISKKGCVSVYGMGRFPVSFYKSQWQRLAKEVPNILAFIEENDAILPEKKVTVKA